MKRALVMIAEGSEELEAVTVIDLLRRARIEVTVAGLSGEMVTASRGVRLLPDMALSDALGASDGGRDFDLVVLPGGLGGVRAFADSHALKQLVGQHLAANKLLGAICAAPAALRQFGLLTGRRVTSYPGSIPAYEQDYTYVEEPVVCDGPLVTSRGPGTAMDFALCLIERLVGGKIRDEVEAALVRP